MTDKAISPLRRRMIEDMTVRGFTASTQRGYIRAVRDFTAFFGRSPDQASAEGPAAQSAAHAIDRGLGARPSPARALSSFPVAASRQQGAMPQTLLLSWGLGPMAPSSGRGAGCIPARRSRKPALTG